MKLTEIKTKTHHYFVDEEGCKQGEYKDWWSSGQLWEISYYRDDNLHGERKIWLPTGQLSSMCHYRDGKSHGETKQWGPEGRLEFHTFYINGNKIINFLENPELYPSTPEEKLMFVLKYGSAPFIREGEAE